MSLVGVFDGENVGANVDCITILLMRIKKLSTKLKKGRLVGLVPVGLGI